MHIIECGAQCTGGNCQADWHAIPNLAEIGYPIVEAEPDGTFWALRDVNFEAQAGEVHPFWYNRALND